MRPDNLIPELHNPRAVLRTQNLERRIIDTIDIGAYWETVNISRQNKLFSRYSGYILFKTLSLKYHFLNKEN